MSFDTSVGFCLSSLALEQNKSWQGFFSIHFRRLSYKTFFPVASETELSDFILSDKRVYFSMNPSVNIEY